MTNFFSWQRFFSNIPKLFSTLPITFEVVFVTYIIGCFFAILLAYIRIKNVPIAKQVIAVFVSFERDTPLLVQMLVSYYGIPLIIEAFFDVDTREWPRITFVFIAFSANVAAFLSEVFRSSILSIPKGQTEAAYSCGMTAGKAFTKIVLPQAFRIALPNMWTFLISLLKSTSLIYMIGVVDIIGRAQAIGSATSHSLESYIIIALVFTVFSLLLQLPYGFVEKKLSFKNSIKEAGK